MKIEHPATVEYEATYYVRSDGKPPIFMESSAVIELLADDTLFVGSGYQSPSDTLELYVLCNDLFWWGTADAEPCKPSELESLYQAWHADKDWGALIWCCQHRNLQPQKPMREAMQKAGVWTEALAALPDPGPS